MALCPSSPAGNSDVVIVKAHAGYLSMDDRANLDAYLRRRPREHSRCVVGPDPVEFATFVGGAKTRQRRTARSGCALHDRRYHHPIMQGMTNFSIKDEAFYSMTWAEVPEVHVLATAVIAATPSAQRAGHAGETVPQIWTCENQLTPAPIALPPSSGCRGISTPTSRTRRFSRCCFAASRGRRIDRWTR